MNIILLPIGIKVQWHHTRMTLGHIYTNTLKVRSMTMERILAAQQIDEETKKLCSDVKKGKVKELSCSKEWILKFRSWLYMPNVDELRWEIMEEAYCSVDAMHPENKNVQNIERKLLLDKKKGWCS